MRRSGSAVCLVLTLSCAARRAEPVRTAPLAARTTGASSNGVAGTPATPVAAHAGSGELEWYRDDPNGAFARARREHKLVVVDLWAAWCHTCSSMQKFVLTGSKLPGANARYVFLAMDTEREQNAEFLRHFPTSGWPTFYVLSPDGPSVRGRWLGAASPGQFARFLADAERAQPAAPATPGAPAAPERLARERLHALEKSH